MDRRRIAVAVLAALTMVATVAACSDPADSGADRTPRSSASRVPALAPAAFAEAASAPDAVVVNVHVPYEGEIEGTDLFIPFDEIVGHPDLPPDRDTRLVLYCRSGNMSEEAGDALLAAGYRDVVHLDGGMVAWEDSGREVRLVDER